MRDNRLMDGQITPFETDFQPYRDKMGVCVCVCVWRGANEKMCAMEPRL